MIESTISLTELKQNLSEIVNRAAYGNERIILLSRGKPRAALISLEELEQIDLLRQETQETRNIQEQLNRLAEMGALREQIQQEFGILTDSVEVLREVREERLHDIMGLS
jgi:prevent-host-death family protein